MSPVVRGRWRLAIRGAGRAGRALGPSSPDLVRVVAGTGPTLAAVLAARARRRPDEAVWWDEQGPLTAAELWRTVDAARLQLAARPVVVHTTDQRVVLSVTLAALAGSGRALVVPARAGADAFRAALAAAPDALPVTGPDWDTAAPAAGSPAVRWFRVRSAGTVAFTTSGTTGRAQAVGHAGGLGPAVQMLGTLGVFPLRRRPLVASAAAIDHGHGFGLLSATLVLGGTFVALPAVPAAVPALVAGLDRPVDLLSGVPRQLADLAQLPAPDRAPIGAPLVLSGSDRLDPATAGVIRRAFGPELYNAYGATETGTVCVATPRDLRAAPGCVGRPVTGVRVRVVDGAGIPVPPGSEGWLEVRSPMLAGPGFRADRGRIDADGRIHVTGRADGAIVTGGETVEPETLRRRLLAFPGVMAADVGVVPDERFGHRLVAEVTLAPGAAADTGTWREQLRRDLGPALTPRELRVRTARR